MKFINRSKWCNQKCSKANVLNKLFAQLALSKKDLKSQQLKKHRLQFSAVELEIIQMKRFQEWQQNQTYFQHLSNLSKIMNRKPSSQKMHRAPRKQKDVLHNSEIEMQNSRLVKCIQNPGRINFRHSSYPHVKKQNYEEMAALAYENFLFGKRILETQPVISKMKLDREYKMHRRALKGMTLKRRDNQTRIQRLKEFQSQVDITLPLKGQGRHSLILIIRQYELYKQKLSSCDSAQLSLQCDFGSRSINSDMVPIEEFTQQVFRFRFRKKLIKEANNINVFIRYHKGNSDLEIGYFSISTEEYANAVEGVAVSREETKPIFKRIGTVTGAVQFQINFAKLVM